METNEKRKKQMSVPADNNDHTRRNRFTGEVIELQKRNARNMTQYFFHEALATLDDKTVGEGASKHWDIVRKNLNWFRSKNAKAYMVLLD